REQGAEPISLEQLYRHLTRGDSVPERAIVLTFDDNYQGFYDHAYPLLKKYNYPAAVFVHTNYVGDRASDHPKMDWKTIKALDAEGLVTFGSHTLSHPDDIRMLPPERQVEELARSKQILEEQLGHEVPFFAYPNGHNDAITQQIARDVGYKMAFTIANGQAEESPNILAINRYIHTRYRKAWQDRERAVQGAPAAVFEANIVQTPVRLEVQEYAGVRLGLVRGGRLSTRRVATRQSVGLFVKEAGGVAGINGTFFADARLRGTSNVLIGPSQTQPDGEFIPETDAYRASLLVNRPLVILGPGRVAIVPFQPGYMNAPDMIRAFMPDFTDLFLAGAWIVHNGTARSREEIQTYAARDFNDPRRRAFFGISMDGELVLGATLEVVTTTRMAEAAAEAGVREAVLLDSGFSTSLVYTDKVIVTGHTTPHIPSRPVPHALVVFGEPAPVVDPELQAFLDRASSALIPVSTTEADRPRRRRKRRRTSPSVRPVPPATFPASQETASISTDSFPPE
ncbi:MAG: polysaccharide deacetylase family protein, partial [Chloroherpetonaceae bacterium]|nr:polysaccharide deacetylase family protein [Chthonomonadaceae bacterium]MDW8207166.1 polysaccharide deacetylase family protein [Chloroherpetonaceae bacterium]